MLDLACKMALPNQEYDPRNFWLGAVGVREDGTIVSGRNGAVEHSTSVESYQLTPSSHAEGRVLRKLGKNGVIYVARILRKDRSIAMAMPCSMCSIRIKGFGVKKVYYTINPNQYGLWDLSKDSHRVFGM